MIIVMHKSNIAKFSERIIGQKLTPDSQVLYHVTG